MIAITHVPSPKMEQCERTYVARTPIDYWRAARQHEEYCRMLRACGADVVTLDANRDLPDCAFVEDTAIVLDEVAVLALMGGESRRAEPAGVEVGGGEKPGEKNGQTPPPSERGGGRSGKRRVGEEGGN